MAAYTQAQGPMAITTPLGKDALLLSDLEGHEAISELFHLRLQLHAVHETKVRFDSILGESVTVAIWLPSGGKRYFNGIVNRFAQGRRDETFTHFEAEVVPRAWLLTRNVQSRIFQDMSVPAILNEVLAGINVQFELFDRYERRDYCVQYRESDFAFAARLMEEEGIYYFFTHADGSHRMVVSDAPDLHPDLPIQPTVIYEEWLGGDRHEMRVTAWQKTQEIRSGKYTLWDHCFELPGKTLEARQSTLEHVQAGTVTHKLRVGGNDRLEIYDYPGGYAQRFDGIDRSGGERPAELGKILVDGERTAKIRMEQEMTLGLRIEGAGDCRHFLPGHAFTLTRHFDADGRYLLTRVDHHARCAEFRSGEKAAFEYENHFACIPAALPYRPLRLTPRPVVGGTQTATVVGPPGEEIFCDKYGRVKVQFHWDRQGQKNAESSCWMRVAQPWAGGGFGAVTIPRVGHEVVVDFLEGDPDQPLVLGSVYNAARMPPFVLPEYRMVSGIKAKSVQGNPTAHFSGLAINDSLGKERVALYAQKDMVVNAENDLKHHVGHCQHVQIGRTSLMSVGGIPGGGGSGGGGGGTTPPPEGSTQSATTDRQGQSHSPSYGNWKTSNGLLSAQPGMAGAVIYGVNSQDTVGFMHQITVGSAYQVCVNPLGYFGFLPNPISASGGPLMGFLGAIGGNVQLCWGTNTQAVYGPAIAINHGPQISITSKPQTATIVLAILVPALSVAYELAFGAMHGDEDDGQASSRAELFAGSVAAIGLANAILLTSEGVDRAADLVKRALSAKANDTLLETTLGIAGSSLLPDFMKKSIPDAKVNAQGASPELPLTVNDDANSINVTDGVLYQSAKHIHLLAIKKPPGPDDAPDPIPSTVYINAAGQGVGDGVVFINGTKGVTLATPPAAVIEMAKAGITVEGGPLGKIGLHCGVPAVGPTITLDPANAITMKIGAPGVGPSITLDLAKGITLKFGANELALGPAGMTLTSGPSKVTVDPAGISLDALNVTLQAKLKHETKAMLAKHQYTLGDLQITLAKHM